MTAISRLPGTIDAVIAALTAADVLTRDGPEVHDDYSDCVYIGYDGDPKGRFKGADTNQMWAGTVGAHRRDEEMEIICSVVCTRGDNETKLVRDAAYDLLGTVESTLRLNPGLGFTSPFVAGVRPRELFYRPFNDGLQARLIFLITVKTRV